VTNSYRPPRLLEPSDNLDGFVCRSDEQTRWLPQYARQATSTGTTRVLVVTQPDRTEVVAYYAWCMASITIADAPPRLRKGAGRYPQPVALLARLGVAIEHEGRGLGAGLLGDVIARAAQLGIEIGCRGLLVHAETAAARDFYLHLIPELEPSPTDELHLVLLMKDILKTLKTLRR
jgi:GNAT superfamily N-acetyltransferase